MIRWKRLTWQDTKRYGYGSLFYRVAAWRGWLHTPSGEVESICTRCWREMCRREQIRRGL